jgi:hypothetical protein
VNWKSLVTQSVLTAAAVLIGIRFLIPSSAGHLEAFQKSLSVQMQLIESRLNKIESTLAIQKQGSFPASGQSTLPQGLNEISQSLHTIMESLARLENKSAISRPQQPPISSVTPGSKVPSMRAPTGTDPTAWIQKLPKKKRSKVEEIFKQHADILRAKLPSGPPPNPETMRQVMEESENELRENLKAVLNDAEYQEFLSSIPKLPDIESLPPPQ